MRTAAARIAPLDTAQLPRTPSQSPDTQQAGHCRVKRQRVFPLAAQHSVGPHSGSLPSFMHKLSMGHLVKQTQSQLELRARCPSASCWSIASGPF